MSSMFSELSLKNLKFTRTKLTKLARREALWGLLFLSPWLIGFLLWTLGPMIASLFFSFTDFNLLYREEMQWIGLDNSRANLAEPANCSRVCGCMRKDRAINEQDGPAY